MGLVSYSDSEGSEAEQVAAPKPKASTNKAKFEKVVDRSNPGKIRVSLASKGQENGENGDVQDNEPPAKRARLGGSSFNSFLPAPKRSGPAGIPSDGSSSKRGIGSGISLKTGATPGFTREPMPEYDELDESIGGEESSSAAPRGEVSEPASSVHISPLKQKDAKAAAQTDPQQTRKPMMFKPLSVTAKKKKKKAAAPQAVTGAALDISPTPIDQTTLSKPKPKVSLFSMETSKDPSISISSAEEYKPMVYDISAESEGEAHSPQVPTESFEYTEDGDQEKQHEQHPSTSTTFPPPNSASHAEQSLTDIAADLNLSEAAKRQLFGRQIGSSKKNNANQTFIPPTAVNVINFNMDQEYAANEAARQAGETVVQNAVRSVAPGKHSLKQLVNAASGQKEALEESFASGRRNKAEAGSKYGW